MKKIIIIGSRRRDSYEDFISIKCVFLTIYKKGDMIVSGEAVSLNVDLDEKFQTDVLQLRIHPQEQLWNKENKNGN